MKVYVITKARPLQEEQYVTVKASAKEAEKFIRKSFPNARKDDSNKKIVNFLCKGYYSRLGQLYGDLTLEPKEDFLMFVREEEI